MKEPAVSAPIRTPADLGSRLRRAWQADTSAAPDQWSPDNAAFGQCAVTALIVQDLFGGELLRGHIVRGTHYWNRLPSGLEVDLTSHQFDGDPGVFDVELRSRAYVLSYPSTSHRYQRLLGRLGFQA